MHRVRYRYPLETVIAGGGPSPWPARDWRRPGPFGLESSPVSWRAINGTKALARMAETRPDGLLDVP
jgi:hypothetical protein